MGRIVVSAETIRQLQVVPREGLRPGTYRFPDFLVAGPQRTGTTWLHRNLNSHPHILLSGRKELHYFNALGKEPSEVKNRVGSEALRAYSGWFDESVTNHIRKLFWDVVYFRSLSRLKWRMRDNVGRPICGELTASYAAMDPSRINDIVTLNPEVRVVIMLRHPVERAWSHFKLRIRTEKRRLSEVSDSEVIEYLTRPYLLRCGRYSVMIENWRHALGPGDQLLLVDYDRISTEPVQLLREITSFVGAPVSDGSTEMAGAAGVVNATERANVPDRFRVFLRQLFDEEIQYGNSQLGMRWA